MHRDIAQQAESHLVRAADELANLYSRTALALNALEVSSKHYEAREDFLMLNTEGKIPPLLRLPHELTTRIDRAALVESYRSVVPQYELENYFIRMVSIVDACIEDIYEACLGAPPSDVPMSRIASKVRSAWATRDDGPTEVAQHLMTMAGLQSSRLSLTEVTFDRYCEIREIRHALVHSAGQIVPKRRDRLLQLQNRLPDDMRHLSWATAHFLEGDSVGLDLEAVLGVRKWTHDAFLMQLRSVFAAIAHAPNAA